MDFNDINERLKRVYHAIDKQYEYDIESNLTKSIERNGNEVAVGVNFGNYDEIELQSRVISTIAAIASLKDHLKTKLKQRGKKPQEVEEAINNSQELSILMDLYNAEKHGYPLTKTIRSHKNPRITNISQGLSIDKLNESASLTFTFSADSNSINNISSSNSVIVINADIVDENGNLILHLDELIDGSVKAFERIIKDLIN